MQRPFELEPQQLQAHLEEMVDITISDLSSEFLLMPAGNSFIRYPEFSAAYETLKRNTEGFSNFTGHTVLSALYENSWVLGVLRAILGLTPPEWAELARTEYGSDISQGAARKLDRNCREISDYIFALKRRYEARLDKSGVTGSSQPDRQKSLERIGSLINVAVKYITQGAPDQVEGLIHRLDKIDTAKGVESLQYVAKENVPYAVLLYERYLGRPFAGHRDAVSDLVGEVMENAIEDRLRVACVSYRKTGRAERIPGFGQAPDFCIPDEINPVVVIEAKITSDDGTARDKVARIMGLVTQRNIHETSGYARYEVVACIDGRGFRERREDMRQLITRLDGKVFTTATLDQLITHTRIQEFVSIPD